MVEQRRHLTAVILGYADSQRLAGFEDVYESAMFTRSLNDDRFRTLQRHEYRR